MGYDVSAEGYLQFPRASEPELVAAIRAAWRADQSRDEYWGWANTEQLASDEPISLAAVLECAGFDEVTDINPPTDPGKLYVTNDHSLDSEALCTALMAIAQWVTGTIECRGEDGALWRWRLEGGLLHEDAGKVVWEAMSE